MLFRGSCYELDTLGPCTNPELGNFVGVNEQTLELVCKNSIYGFEIDVRDPLSDSINKIDCLPGGRRYYQKKCPSQLEQSLDEQSTSKKS